MDSSTFQDHYKILNPEQLDAVESLYGPIMVVAGPGTGKTQVISLRVANIILKTWIHPENILVTTFTEAWVVALKKRLTTFIGTDAYKVKICTLHSFAQDVITQFPEKFIEQRAGNTIDEIDALEFFTQTLDEKITTWEIEYLFHPSDRFAYLRDIKDRIGKLKNEWILPDAFHDIIQQQRNIYIQNLETLKNNKRIKDLEKRTQKDQLSYDTHIAKLEELLLLYRCYQTYLRENNLYDFSDMINFVVETMKIDEDLKSYYAEKYQFIMLDEYQDTNNAQNNIINLILSVSEDKNIMVVWDDDQSIYRFQGANIENMLDFYTLYPETKFITLKNNYRSPQSILDISKNVIENNDERLVNRLDFLDKTLTSYTSYKNIDQNISYILPDEYNEKIFVYNDIMSKISIDKDTSPRIAIIVRSNKEVMEWSDFMQLQWVSIESKLKTNILSNQYVRYIIHIAKIVHDPYCSDEILLNILRSDIIDVDNLDVIHLARNLYIKNYSKSWFALQLWDSIRDIDIDILTSEDTLRNKEKLITFRDMITSLQSDAINISSIFHTLITHLGLIEYIEKKGSFEDIEDVFSFLNTIKSWHQSSPNITLEGIINKCYLHQKYGIVIPRQILKKTQSCIEILTAHSSKWLEYDHVYIPGMYAGNWENKRIVDKLKLPLGMVGQGLQFSDLDEKSHKDIIKQLATWEDRRLFFVAITRAKQSLTFTRPSGKNNKPYIDSPFLFETWLDVKIWEDIWDEKMLQKFLISQISHTNNLISTNDDEIDYISEFLDSYKLSATDLNMFLEDPLLFLQNVVFKYPFIDNEYTIFGKLYHRVLELATIRHQTWEPVDLTYMLETFNILLSKQILTKEEQRRLIKKWHEWLTWYYEVFSQNTRTILATEYNFRSRNIVFEGIPITGKIDKIEKLEALIQFSTPKGHRGPNERNEDQSMWQNSLFKESVAIVDYKTGSIKSQSMIKWTDRYWNIKPWYEYGKYYRQLMFYSLLWEHDQEFSSKYSIDELAIDFVEGKNNTYKYQPIDIDTSDYQNFKQLILDSWSQINDLEYWRGVLKK